MRFWAIVLTLFAAPGLAVGAAVNHVITSDARIPAGPVTIEHLEAYDQ